MLVEDVDETGPLDWGRVVRVAGIGADAAAAAAANAGVPSLPAAGLGEFEAAEEATDPVVYLSRISFISLGSSC